MVVAAAARKRQSARWQRLAAGTGGREGRRGVPGLAADSWAGSVVVVAAAAHKREPARWQRLAVGTGGREGRSGV